MGQSSEDLPENLYGSPILRPILILTPAQNHVPTSITLTAISLVGQHCMQAYPFLSLLHHDEIYVEASVQHTVIQTEMKKKV